MAVGGIAIGVGIGRICGAGATGSGKSDPDGLVTTGGAVSIGGATGKFAGGGLGIGVMVGTALGVIGWGLGANVGFISMGAGIITTGRPGALMATSPGTTVGWVTTDAELTTALGVGMG